MRRLHTVADPGQVRHTWSPISLNWAEFVLVGLIVVLAVVTVMALLWR